MTRTADYQKPVGADDMVKLEAGETVTLGFAPRLGFASKLGVGPQVGDALQLFHMDRAVLAEVVGEAGTQRVVRAVRQSIEMAAAAE